MTEREIRERLEQALREHREMLDQIRREHAIEPSRPKLTLIRGGMADR